MTEALNTDASFPCPRWHRVSAYTVAWLAPLAVMAWAVPRYADLLKQLDELGELPTVVNWSLAFVRLNQANYYLPATVTFVAAITVAEALRRSLRRARWERSGDLVWRLGIVSVGLLAWLLALAPQIFS